MFLIMSKNLDLVKTLLIIIIGMFIPFIGSITLTYGLDFTDVNDWLKIGYTFSCFLLIFGIELLMVYLYFVVTSKIASQKIDKYKPKK
ncbi:MAG: hypothetical protein FE039_01630 [Thermoplasmata archaeon]|nr:MAG: hypothetical protein FE039_01630 [Thermoplasmata archaeon]